MHKHVEALAAVLIGASCSDADPLDSLSTMESPSMATPSFEEEYQSGMPAGDQWRACHLHGQSECLAFEQCVRDDLEAFAVCMRECVSVDDCIEPSLPAHDGFGAIVTCSEFEGASRCVLNCQDASECPPQMACMRSACVWSMRPALDPISDIQSGL